MIEDIQKWLEEQILFLSPPNFLTQQNTTINPCRYMLVSIQEIAGEHIADYMILDNFLWARFKKYHNGWRYISSCLNKNGEFINTSHDKIVNSFLAKILFNNKTYDDNNVFCLQFSDGVLADKNIMTWIDNVSARDDVILSYNHGEPQYLLSSNAGVLDEYLYGTGKNEVN